MKTSLSTQLQRGLSLIESLVAIAIMAMGLLGILGIQMRTLADTQTGVRRAQAIRLIEDLSERLQLNPNGVGNLANYASTWGNIPALPGCTNCTAAQRAAVDMNRFKTAVQNTLPLGDAAVFTAGVDTVAGNERQLGIMIAWRESEREASTNAETLDLKSLFSTATTSGVACPANMICHIQYIVPSQRCAPQLLAAEAGVVPVYCQS